MDTETSNCGIDYRRTCDKCNALDRHITCLIYLKKFPKHNTTEYLFDDLANPAWNCEEYRLKSEYIIQLLESFPNRSTNDHIKNEIKCRIWHFGCCITFRIRGSYKENPPKGIRGAVYSLRQKVSDHNSAAYHKIIKFLE